jgi:DNA-directed RNA polymerase omega subunit
MLHPSLGELLKKIDNRYLLVNITAKRARDLAAEAEANETPLAEKPVKMALNEILSGRIVPLHK